MKDQQQNNPVFQYRFDQLAVLENGRTPLLLTQAQYERAAACEKACEGSSTEWLRFITNPDHDDQFGPFVPFETKYQGVLQKALAIKDERDKLQAELNALKRLMDDSRQDRRLGAATQRAAAELPEGYELHIEVEKGAGTVRLYLPDGEEADDDFSGGDYFHEQVDNAINVAIAHAEKGGAA